MKRLLIVFVLAFCVGFKCHKAPSSTVKELRLQTFEEQLSGMGLSSDGAMRVDVTFGGPILIITDEMKRRAILPRDLSGHHPHKAVLFVSSSEVDVGQFQNVFPKACEDQNGSVKEYCAASLERVGLQVVPVAASIWAYDKSNSSFQAAQHMKRTGFLPELHADVEADDPPMNSPVQAYFVLDKGELVTVPFAGCPARFINDNDMPNFRLFAATTTAKMAFHGRALLQARTPTSNGWKSIDLKNRPALYIGNLSDTLGSHHDIFGSLAKGGYVDLPDVETESCLQWFGTVPGCGNDQWP